MDDGKNLPLMAQTHPDDEISNALRIARETLPQKEYEPFGVLPLREDEGGIHFDPYAGALGAVTRPLKYFKETMTGEKPMDVTSPEAIEAAINLAGGMTLGSGAYEAPAGALRAGLIRPIRAYHGSPHLFPPTERNPLGEFDLSKIGTGEGAQAFGHGAYLAELENIAKSYRDALNVKDDSYIARLMGDAFGIDEAIKRVNDRKNKNPNVINELKKWKSSGIAPELKSGHMYEVDIHADPEHLLDWDKPLPLKNPIREQIAELSMKATGENWPEARNAGRDAMRAALNENLTGEGAYHQLSKLFQTSEHPWEKFNLSPENTYNIKEAASKSLLEQGIPGIKYLDAGSRSAGEGSRNYVIFDPSIIEILRRYASGGQVSDDINDALRVARHRLQSGGVPEGVPDEASQEAFLQEQLQGSAPQYDPEAGLQTAKEAGRAIAQMTTPGALADMAGYLGGPSAYENLRNQHYIDAALQLASVIPGAGAVAKGAALAKAAPLLAVVPTSIAKTIGKKSLPETSEFLRAVETTPGARIEEGSLVMPVVRGQKPEQELSQSVRGGVFYLPKGDKNARYYGGSWNYGGNQKIQGETAFNNPLVVKGATGGKAPETAFAMLNGKDALKKLQKDVQSVINEQMWMTRQDPSLYQERVENLLESYGADPSIASYLIKNSNKGNQLRYALQEYIIGNSARRAGYDSILGYGVKRDTAKSPFFSEIFDLRESHYPSPSGEYRLHPEFVPQEPSPKTSYEWVSPTMGAGRSFKTENKARKNMPSGARLVKTILEDPIKNIPVEKSNGGEVNSALELASQITDPRTFSKKIGGDNE
jgi:hypothetical protein